MKDPVKHKLSAKVLKDIKSLAVSYEAYSAAFEKGDDNGVVVWGPKVLELQKAFGIDLVAPVTTKTLIDQATKRMVDSGIIAKSAGEQFADHIREIAGV